MEQAIRVLCVFSTLDRGGAETMCMNLYRHIDREKVQLDFVKHTPQVGAFEEEIRALGGRIFEAPRYKVYNHLSYCAWWKKHLREHPEHQIIHGHYFTISAVFFCVAKKMGRVTVAHSHATEGSDNRVKNTIEEYWRKKLPICSDHLFACSTEAGKYLYGEGGICDERFVILNNALDAEQFRFNPTAREKYRSDLGLGDSLVLGTVANLSAVKNPWGLIDIVKAVFQRHPDSKLLWVGEGGMRKGIEERLSAEGLENQVILLGNRNDVPDILQAMDVFLLPSFSEGLGLAAVEAQAAGLPCFLSDAVPEEANVTGRCTFLPLGDPKAWTDAILSADLTREDTTQQIKAAGYDIHTTAKWLQEFYLEIEGFQK